MSFSICLGKKNKKKKKKNADVSNFLGILKKYVSMYKTCFYLKRKAMFWLIKKLFLSFTQFSDLIS